MSPVLGLTFIAQHEICGSSKGRVTELLEDTAKRRALAVQENGGFCFFGGFVSCHGGSLSWLPCSEALWEKGGMWCISVHVHACLYVKHFSVLYSFTAVISAHPIHSLDNPHHHFHSGSLASPTRSYLHHQVNPWPIGTSMSHSDRANSTGEI